MNTLERYEALLNMSAACFEVQVETARQYAKTRDCAANLGLAQELDRNARVIREALADSVEG